MPPVRLAVADRGHDARGLACLEDDHHCIGARAFEVGVDEVVAPAMRGVQNRDIPLLCPTFQPMLELLGDAAKRVAADGYVPINVEEPNTRSGCWNG